jgi:hypothetical protein
MFGFVLQQRFSHATDDYPATAPALRQDQNNVAMLEGTSLEAGRTTRLRRSGYDQLPDDAALDMNEIPCG